MAPVPDTASNEFRNHLNSLVYDQKHFTARGLRQLNETSGVEQFSLAVVFLLITAFFLIAADNAGFVANSLLTVTPLMLTYFYPDEKPSNDQLLIYWGAFGLVTLLDPSYTDVKGYYLVKVLLLALLFMRPINGADWILKHLQTVTGKTMEQTRDNPPKNADNRSHTTVLFTKSEIRDMERRSLGRKSPPPEPPESLTSKEQYTDRTETTSEKSTLHTARDDSKANAKPTGPQASPRPKSENLKTAERLSSETPLAMAACSSSSYTISDDVNPHDLSFEPSNNFVFNAPFDTNTGPYQFKANNTSTRVIAFAVKSNAIKRLTVRPTSAVIQPKKSILVTISLKPFAYDQEMVAKDRVKFEYVYCPRNTTKFTFKLLQQKGTGDLRRQKNIHILYNP